MSSTVVSGHPFSLVGIPLGILLAFWFMRVSDTPKRMPFFIVGVFSSSRSSSRSVG